MSPEIHLIPRNFEDSIQTTAFTELPWMLHTAQLWMKERRTMDSVTQAIENKFYRYPEHGYKVDFHIAYNYLGQAVEEAKEFVSARSDQESGELGDTLFELLHYANRAGIMADNVVLYFCEDAISGQLSTRLSLPAKFVNLIHRKSSVLYAVDWLEHKVRRENINLIGPMSFDDGPWTLDRGSVEWASYQQSLTSNWAMVFGVICKYSLRNNISLLETIYQTAAKAGYNFPPAFFMPETTPFSSGPTNNMHEIACCRILRKSFIYENETYMDRYHSVFDGQNVAENPKSLE